MGSASLGGNSGSAGTGGNLNPAGNGGSGAGGSDSGGSPPLDTGGSAGSPAGQGGQAGTGGASGGTGGSIAGSAGTAGEAAGEPGTSGSAGTAGSGETSGAGGASGTAGAAGDAGTSGAAGAGGAPECEGDLGGCFDGAQPRLCIDGKWEDAGGICNFGCSTGKCACSAPDRFSFFYDGIIVPPGYVVDEITDEKLWKRWWISEVATFDQAKLMCATHNFRLPTLTEAKSLMAQQSDAIQCSQTKNLDKTFVDAAKENNTATSLDTPIWTSDLDNTGMVLIVQLTSGQVSTRDPAENAPSTLFCIQK